MALTVTLDQAVYAPGDPMTLTVVSPPEDRDRYVETPFTVTVSVPGTGTGEATANLREQVSDAPVIVTDPDRAWTLTSDDGETAVFESVA